MPAPAANVNQNFTLYYANGKLNYDPRHGNGTLFGFADGHVEYLNAGTGITAAVNTKGWLWYPYTRTDVQWKTANATVVYYQTGVGTTVSGIGSTKGSGSSQHFDGNGYLEFKVPYSFRNDVSLSIGIGVHEFPYSNYPTSQIGYALVLGATRTIQESGTTVFSNVTLSSRDLIRIERVGSTIYYKKNGVIFYTSNNKSSGSLYPDYAGGNLDKLSGCVLFGIPDTTLPY